jgi:excisionase family DNA binding protein
MIRQQFYTAKQVCEALQISRATLSTWMKEGMIEFIKFEKSVRFSPKSLEKLIEERTVRSSSL